MARSFAWDTNKPKFENLASADDVINSGLLFYILLNVISGRFVREGSQEVPKPEQSKKFKDLLPLDGGTVGIAHYAVGGLAALYDLIDCQKYFGKSKETMKKDYSSDCRPKGKEGNDTGWGCYSQSFWKKGMEAFLDSAESEDIQFNAYKAARKDLLESAISNGWKTPRQFAIAVGIANSVGDEGFKSIAKKQNWDSEKTLNSYVGSNAHRKRRKRLIDYYFPESSQVNTSDELTAEFTIGEDEGFTNNPIVVGTTVPFFYGGSASSNLKFEWTSSPTTGVTWNKSTDPNPTAVFSSPGEFTFTLRVSSTSTTQSVSYTSKNSNDQPEVLKVKEKEEPPKKEDPPPSEVSNKEVLVDPKTINSKITLKKKSGPGELKGIVEGNVVNGVVNFNGLQFDQPGTYVIEVIPENPLLEKTEFTIEVEKEPEIIEQNKKPQEEEKSPGERPIIAQIDEPNIKLPPIKKPLPAHSQEALEQISSIGIRPLLAYSRVEIARDIDINFLLLYYEDNLPKCKVRFRDTLGLLQDQPPRDDTKFEVFLNATDPDLKSIHMAFKITNHKKDDTTNKIATWTFEGVIHVDDLFVPSSKSYQGTSYEVLRKIAKKLDLGFNSNVDKTDDDMKWINTNKMYKDFIKEIVEHSYKDDKSFLYAYVDYYYGLTYVDVEKEWNRDNSNDKFIDTAQFKMLSKTERDKKLLPLRLTNEPSQNISSNYFEGFKIINQSTKTKLETGYRTKVRYYDEEKKSFLEFEVDSQSTDDNKNIVLKGEQGDNKFLDKKVDNKFLGKIDNDNVHKNYNYAVEQNRKNLDNLTSIAAIIELPHANFNLYRFQKVNCLFYNLGNSITKEYEIDFRYTGSWIIIDIQFEWTTKVKGAKMVQKLVIVRKELGKTPEELKNTPPPPPPPPPPPAENKKNENTEPNKNKPNAKYTVGQIVLVQKADGTKYEVEVTKILENGIEIEGKLKKLN